MKISQVQLRMAVQTGYKCSIQVLGYIPRIMPIAGAEHDFSNSLLVWWLASDVLPIVGSVSSSTLQENQLYSSKGADDATTVVPDSHFRPTGRGCERLSPMIPGLFHAMLVYMVGEKEWTWSSTILHGETDVR